MNKLAKNNKTNDRKMAKHFIAGGDENWYKHPGNLGEILGEVPQESEKISTSKFSYSILEHQKHLYLI